MYLSSLSSRENVAGRQNWQRGWFQPASGPAFPVVLLAGLLPLLLVIGSCPQFLNAQQPEQTPPVALPQLLTLSIAAMSGGVQLTDVTLTGTVESSTKSGHESGTVTLRTTASGCARVDLQFPSGSKSEVSGVADTRHYGYRQDESGAVHPISLHNLLVDPAWFAPVMTLINMSSAAQKEGSVVVLPSVDGDPIGTAHIRFAAVTAGQTDMVDRELFRMSREDIFVDAATLTPIEIRFNTHLDQNARANKPVKIEYLSYTTFNGVLLPSHIRKTVDVNARNNPDDRETLDIMISAVTINTGVTDASLQLQ